MLHTMQLKSVNMIASNYFLDNRQKVYTITGTYDLSISFYLTHIFSVFEISTNIDFIVSSFLFELIQTFRAIVSHIYTYNYYYYIYYLH